MKSFKAAIAALAMVAGAQQAQAARWVEYVVTGEGTVYNVVNGMQAGSRPTIIQGRFVVDAEAGLFSQGEYYGESTGTSFSYRYRGALYSAEFTPTSITARFSELTAVGEYTWYFTNTAIFGIIPNRGSAMTYDATVQSFLVRDVPEFSPAFVALDVPEPSTWALLLLGFGGVGTAMRRRVAADRRPITR